MELPSLELADCEQWLDEFRLPEEMYRTILDNSAVAITVADEIEGIVFWNQAAETLLGMDKRDLLLKPVGSLYPPEEWERIRAEDLRQRGIQHHMETKIVRRDGEVIDVDLSLSMLKDAEDNVTGSVGVMRDISLRKKMEREVWRAEEMYRTVFESSAVAITVTGGDEEIVSWNNAAELLLGMDEPDLLMRPVQSLYPQEEWERIRALNIRQKGIQHQLKTRMVKKGGETVDVSLSVSVLRDCDGNVTGSIGVISDISDSVGSGA
jgi:PAS domain S-box-containing protein